VVWIAAAGKVNPCLAHVGGKRVPCRRVPSSPLYLDEFARTAPRDWNAKNVEFLIKANIVDGDPGPPR
jgi:hypothetical protein